MLLGRESFLRLNRAHVAIFGLGGVGGHAVEALARSGIGELTLVDGDFVTESNLNRQLFATLSSVGARKVDAAEERILSLRSDVILHKIHVFVTSDGIKNRLFDFTKFDYVIDAIDTVTAKIAIIEECTRLEIPIISAMGAGNKLNPTRFEVTDIYKTSGCPLAAVMRKELKKRGIRRLKVVFSPENRVKPAFLPTSEGGEGSRKPTPASCAFVPSVAGLIMAGEVIKDLCCEELAASLAEREV